MSKLLFVCLLIFMGMCTIPLNMTHFPKKKDQHAMFAMHIAVQFGMQFNSNGFEHQYKKLLISFLFIKHRCVFKMRLNY